MSDAQDAPLEFAPPASYAFEPELLPPAPRPIPDSVEQGKYFQKQRRGAQMLLVGGACCLLFFHLPFVRKLGVFLLPLAYLDWIGYGLLALAGVSRLQSALKTGRYRYLRDGVPIVARVVSLQKIPFLRVNGQDSTYGYAAGIVIKHPESAELKPFIVKSPDFSAAKKDRYETTLRVSQYVTALYLPGKLEKTLNLYGFLELNPELKFVYDTAENDADNPWRGVRTALALAVAIGAGMGCWYALSFCAPVNFAPTLLWPSLAGGSLLGGAFLLHLWKRHKAEQELLRERNRIAQAEGKAVEPIASSLFAQTGFRARLRQALLVPGSVLIGSIAVGCALLAANALLDGSAAEQRPVRILGLKQTTYDFVFRSYSVEYAWEGSAKKEDFPLLPEQLHTFFSAHTLITNGFAEVHAGRLGWPWIKRVAPASAEM